MFSVCMALESTICHFPWQILQLLSHAQISSLWAPALESSLRLESSACVGSLSPESDASAKYLDITALDVIAPHARYKVWIKQNGEMPYLYGGNVVKAHVGRWSEDIPEHQGVVVLGMDDTPLVRHAGEWHMAKEPY